MKPQATIITGLALAGALLWVAPANRPAAVALSSAHPFTYSEQPLTMDAGTGIYVRIDVEVPPGRTAVVEWAVGPGWAFQPIHEIPAPFAYATQEMFHRFVVSNDVLGLYAVTLK